MKALLNETVKTRVTTLGGTLYYPCFYDFANKMSTERRPSLPDAFEFCEKAVLWASDISDLPIPQIPHCKIFYRLYKN